MDIPNMKEELMKQVNPESAIAMEKAYRYLSLAELYQKLQEVAMKQPMIVIKNGKQEYTKTNPALTDINRINGALIALGRDMGLTSPPSPGVDKGKSGYSEGDLT